MEERVLADRAAELVSLAAGRQLAVNQQVGGLKERGGMAGDQLLDRDAPIPEDSLFTVDERDRRLARASVHESVVERHQPRLGAQVRGLLVSHGSAPGSGSRSA